MGIISKIFRKKEAIQQIPAVQELPEELERFRTEPQVRDKEFHAFAGKFVGSETLPTKELPNFPPIGAPITVEEAFHEAPAERKHSEPVDKLDLIISKLETIDERLKVVEERLARRM